MLRTAYPDEYPRIKAIMYGMPVPPKTEFLVFIKEQPVERIIAVFPWWLSGDELDNSTNDDNFASFSLYLAGALQLSEEQLQQALSAIEEKAVLSTPFRTPSRK